MAVKITTVRLPEELFWRFQEEQAKRRVSNEAAYREAVTQWIDAADEVAAPKERKVFVSGKHADLHAQLDAILDRGVRSETDSVRTILQVINERHAQTTASAGAPVVKKKAG